MGIYHSSGSWFDPHDGLAAKKAQQEIDAQAGNSATKCHDGQKRSQQNEEAVRDGEQRNCAEG